MAGHSQGILPAGKCRPISLNVKRCLMTALRAFYALQLSQPAQRVECRSEEVQRTVIRQLLFIECNSTASNSGQQLSQPAQRVECRSEEIQRTVIRQLLFTKFNSTCFSKSASPTITIHSFCNIIIERRLCPIPGLINKPMLNRVNMYVIKVVYKILRISYCMFPETILPYSNIFIFPKFPDFFGKSSLYISPSP